MIQKKSVNKRMNTSVKLLSEDSKNKKIHPEVRGLSFRAKKRLRGML